MQPKDFVYKYITSAKNVQLKTGVPALVTLVQAAVESKWGDVAPGFNFFGVKSQNGLLNNSQLLLTHEYLNNPNVKFPKVVAVVQKGNRIWEYTVYDYFRKYDTAEDGFIDHAEFLVKNERYKEALSLKDPIEVLKGIAAAGYATDPNYASLLVRVADMIKKYMI